MSTEAKCNCQYCSGHVSFPVEMAGQTVECPHCQLETRLFIPPAVSLQKTASSPKPKNAALSWVIAGLVLITVVTAFGFMQDTPTNSGDGFGTALLRGAATATATAAVIGLYFIPAIVARDKRKRNFAAIFVLNLFAGWTFIGWLVALVWACTVENKNG